MSEDQTHSGLESASLIKKKMCHIVKRDDFDGYGFNLHSEKTKPGQYIGKVDKNSPAEAAGLQEGDQIIEVNGVAIGNESHKQVVQRIKSIESEVRLLLLDIHRNSLSKHHSTPFPSIPAPLSNDGESVDLKINNNENMFENTVHFNSENCPNIDSKGMIIKQTAGNECKYSFSKDGNMVPDDYTAEKRLPYSSNIINEIIVSGGDQDRNRMSSSSEAGTCSRSPNASNLELPMTAAEMRAKLSAKKKYNPKTDIVDIRKKFDIIEKL